MHLVETNFELFIDLSYMAKNSREKLSQLQEKHILLEKFHRLAVSAII